MLPKFELVPISRFRLRLVTADFDDLSAARWPQQDDEFALVQFKVDRAQRVNGDFAHSINLRQLTSAEDGFARRRSIYRSRRY
jgi:hypothetical protein